LAEAFENLLTDASGGILRAFRSSDRKGTSGIAFGAEWYATIMEKLQAATDVVAILTSNSVARPWILYEVGVARGKLSTQAFGVAIGIGLEDLSGPFAQLQNSGDDEDSLTKLVLQLIRRNPEAAPREEAVRRQVAAFREQLPTLSKASIAPKGGSDGPNVGKLFEEVKVMFREIQETLKDRTNSAPVVSPRNLELVDLFDRTDELLNELARAPRTRRRKAFERLFDEIYPRMPEGSGKAESVNELWQALGSTDNKRLRAGVKQFNEYVEGISQKPADTPAAITADLLRRTAAIFDGWISETKEPEIPNMPK